MARGARGDGDCRRMESINCTLQYQRSHPREMFSVQPQLMSIDLRVFVKAQPQSHIPPQSGSSGSDGLIGVADVTWQTAAFLVVVSH